MASYRSRVITSAMCETLVLEAQFIRDLGKLKMDINMQHPRNCSSSF